MPKSVFKNLWDTIQNGEIWKGIIKNKSKYGETYFVNTMIMPVYDENKKIIEYMDIMFLVTQEENEKRDFKKKVLTNYQELRKINYEISKKNEVLEQSLKISSNDKLSENSFADEIKVKNKKLLTQIQFFENELRKKDLIHEKSIEKASLTLKDINELYKKALIKIKLLEKENEFLKNDSILRKKEIDEINDKLKKQNLSIINLKKMNIKESKEHKEEKSFFDMLK